MILNFPVSRKIIGCNIYITPTQTASTFWSAWDWAGVVKPQIDHAAALGCNCVRVFGSLLPVLHGGITQATYNAQWQQLVSYCAGLGIYVHVTPGNATEVNNWNDISVTDTSNLVIALLAALSSYNNIIGVDVLNEANILGGSPSEVITLYNNIKAGGTVLPLGFSTYATWTNEAKTWISSISSALDYLDFHFYVQNGYADGNSPISAAGLNYWRSTYPNLDILFGEYGQPESATWDNIYAFNKCILNVSLVGDPKVRGANMWATIDQDTVNTDEWGMYSTAYAPRFSRINVIKEATGGSIESRY